MGRNIFRQSIQVRKSDTYDDTIVPTLANFETNPANIEDDLNNVRSQLSNLLDAQAGNWYDDLVTPSALEAGTERGVNDMNTDLHALEKARRLRRVYLLQDIVVTAAQNWEVLGAGEIPSQTTAAVGSVSTLGTVVASIAGSFGAFNLAAVSGSHALNPKNLLEITDGNGDPMLSSSRRIWGLLQSEVATDGHTINTTTQEVQISFVRPNAANTALEAVTVGDIAGKTIRYKSVERIRNEDLNEQDYLSGAAIDIGSGAVTVNLQVAHDNQSTTPVDVATNIFVDLEAAGIAYRWRDDAEANLFGIVEGSAGGTSKVEVNAGVDVFDVDAVLNNFLNGASFDTGAAGTTVNVGVTANQIDAGGALKVLSTSADLSLEAGLELNMTDSFRAGSTWSLAEGVSLSKSSAEWDAYEVEYGEVSLLSAMVKAASAGGIRKVHAICTVAAAADADVSGPTNDNNLDTDLGDLSKGSFVDDYETYYNGGYQRPGLNAAANHDVYPGTALANGQLKFEHALFVGDEIAIFDRAA